MPISGGPRHGRSHERCAQSLSAPPQRATWRSVLAQGAARLGEAEETVFDLAARTLDTKGWPLVGRQLGSLTRRLANGASR